MSGSTGWKRGASYTRTMTRGRLAGVFAAVVVAATLGVVLAGRGAGSPVAAAATKTSETSAHLAFTLTVDGPKLAHAIQVSGSGGLDGPSADVTIQDSGAPAGFPTSIHAIALQQGGDELAFVRVTPAPSFFAGKDWVEVDLSKLASAHGLDLGSLGASGSAETPAQVLDLLRSAGATVTDLGPDTIDGAATTHYRVLVDAAEIAKVAGLPSSIAGNLGRHGTTTVPVGVWIGSADGLVRQVAVDLHHGAGHASFTATLSDYGTSVSVSAPPSSDVFDVTGFLSGASGSRMQPFS